PEGDLEETRAEGSPARKGCGPGRAREEVRSQWRVDSERGPSGDAERAEAGEAAPHLPGRFHSSRRSRAEEDGPDVPGPHEPVEGRTAPARRRIRLGCATHFLPIAIL